MPIDLSRVLLCEELRRLHRERRTGVLEVSRGEVTKGIFLLEGRVAFASSTVPRDKLGESLIQLGRINRAEFTAAFQAALVSERRLGAALVGAGLLSEVDLGRLVAQQVENIVLSLFTLISGTADFHPGEHAVPPDLALELSTRRLLLEGARIYPDVSRLEVALGDVHRRLALSSQPGFDWTRVPLSRAEKAALNRATDGLRISEILCDEGTPRPALVRAVYALLLAGILTEAGEDDLPIFEVDTGTFRLGPGGRADGQDQ